ncbi:unnamed protein product, partial [Darwinula stevensoni]
VQSFVLDLQVLCKTSSLPFRVSIKKLSSFDTLSKSRILEDTGTATSGSILSCTKFLVAGNGSWQFQLLDDLCRGLHYGTRRCTLPGAAAILLKSDEQGVHSRHMERGKEKEANRTQATCLGTYTQGPNHSRYSFPCVEPSKDVGASFDEVCFILTVMDASDIFGAERRSFMSPPNSSRSIMNTTLVIGATDCHAIESYGGMLPYLVTEVLRTCNASSPVSVQLKESGYAWLVSGRRLLVWKYLKEPEGEWKKSGTPHFWELKLPPSALAHKADLVCLIEKDVGAPGCMAVAPEGTIRFWSSITRNTSSHDASTDLQGEECDRLLNFGPELGCILSTTTGSVMLLTLDFLKSGTRNRVSCRQLRMPQGLLGGMGRRLTGFIFPTMPGHTESGKVYLVSHPGEDGRGHLLYVMHAGSIKQWFMCETHPEELQKEIEIEKALRHAFIMSQWADLGSLANVKLWFLDVQWSSSLQGILILAAASLAQVGSQVYFGVALYKISKEVETMARPNLFVQLDHTELFQEPIEHILNSYHLISYAGEAIVYNKDTILCQKMKMESKSETEVIQFRSGRDLIIGSGISSDLGSILFLCQSHGLVCLRSTEVLASPQGSPHSSFIGGIHLSDTLNLTLPNFNPEFMKRLYEDKALSLKVALIHYCRKEIVQSRELVEKIFSSVPHPTKAIPNAPLDRIVVQVSEAHLLDDFPAKDPRWAESIPRMSLPSSMSVILMHQLRDKRQVHNLFIRFLQDLSLWDKLGIVRLQHKLVSTKQVLRDHAEKLVAAVSLYGQSQKPCMRESIKGVVSQRRSSESPKMAKLEPEDVFFREVSKVDDIFPAFISLEEEALLVSTSPEEFAANTIVPINEVILFSWYLEKGIVNKLLQLDLQENDSLQLTEYLQDHDPRCMWVQVLSSQRHDEGIDLSKKLQLAAENLRQLALGENASAVARQTLLSLSKLAFLSCGQEEKIEELDWNLYLSEYQSELPESVLAAMGKKPENMNVLSPEEMALMYVCDDNKNLIEEQVLKALHLLSFGNAPVHELQLQIWSQVLKRDAWASLSVSEGVWQVCKKTLFFRVLLAARSEGVVLQKSRTLRAIALNKDII